MKIPYGPRLMRRRRRRQGKAIVLAVLLMCLTAASSMTTWDKPECAEPDMPTASELAYARNIYSLTGYCGEAKVYVDRWPEYADYIMGK